jgi:alkylated DNA nucleotide flippase Atl1
VRNYGQITDMLGEDHSARTVGFVMFAAGEMNVPLQSVINARGACSTARVVIPPDRQQRLLEAKGKISDDLGECDLARYRRKDESGHPVDAHLSLFSNCRSEQDHSTTFTPFQKAT